MKKLGMVLLTVSVLLGSSSITAFAQANDPAQQTEQVIEEQPAEKKEEEPAKEETAFSTPGNGKLVDDKGNDSTKQFLTVQTKNGNTFYMVIDRSGTSENVYMMSLVDENDLAEFLDGTKVNDQKEEPAVVLPETTPKPETEVETEKKPETEVKPEANQNNPVIGYVVLGSAFLLVFGGIVAFGYQKLRKKKEEGIEEEGLEFAEDAYINEDEEANQDKRN